jgi:hypothetical protein
LPRRRVSSSIALVCAAALLAAVAGCKNSAQVFESQNDGGWFSKPLDLFAKPDWARPTGNTAGVNLGPSGPVAAEDLVGVDGRCGMPVAPVAEAAQASAPAPETPPPDRPVGSVAGDLAGAPKPASASPGIQDQPPSAPTVMGGVALGMSECDVVRRAGLANNVNVGGGDKGERKVVLTYLTGPWPGIYTFGDGRLREVNRAPEPPAPPKAPPKKGKAKTPVKPKTAATPALRQLN